MFSPRLRVKGGRVGASVKEKNSSAIFLSVYSQQLLKHNSLLSKSKYDLTRETVLCFLSCFDYFTLFFAASSAQLGEQGIWLTAFLGVFQQIAMTTAEKEALGGQESMMTEKETEDSCL